MTQHSPFRAGDLVRCIEEGHEDYGAQVIKGRTYTISNDQHSSQTVWIFGEGRWRADRFELVEAAPNRSGPIRYDRI